MMTSSKKCSQCSLINFADAEECKRCGAKLSASSPEISPTPQPVQPSQHPNLFPCHDCGHMISRQAEACPSCGRFIQRIQPPAVQTGTSFSAFLAGFLFVASVITGLIGLVTLYGPERLVGGDAFNYIIAGSRGTGLLIVALCFLLLAIGLDIRREIITRRG